MVRTSIKIWIGITAALLIGAGAWYAWQNDGFVADVGDVLPFAREVITPPPLRGPQGGQLAQLTEAGVFTFTNEHREENNVAALTRNSTLDTAAENKMNDMFARQYFEHVSPTGEGPADVVEAVGYSYVKVGENLALGNFASDEALVQAWMDSPGHRANILNSGYQEIGIAVGRGIFEGEETWIGVQTFATPSSACPMPDSNLEAQIQEAQAQIEALKAALEAPEADREATIQEIQRLMQEAQSLVDQGRAKIDEGNAKIEEGNKIYEDTGDKDQAQPYWDEGKQLQEEGRDLIEQAESLQQEAVALDAQLKNSNKNYNQQVAQVNRLIEETQKLVQQYNAQVQEFNVCVENLGK